MSVLQQLEEHLPYRVDEKGVPLLNEVVRYFLDKCNISAEEFGRRLGRLTRSNHEPYTKGRIYQMLQDNSFPSKKSRRWAIAKLLQIPPALMGVNSLDELLHEYQQTTVTAPVPQTYTPHPFNYEEYKATLTKLWKQHRMHSGSTCVTEIDLRTSVVEHELLYGEADIKEKDKIAALLCGHRMLSSNIATDLQDFDNAIRHLNYAHIVAKERGLTHLQGGILLRRGWALNERGEAYILQNQLELAQADFTKAAGDFTVGLALSEKLPGWMYGSLVFSQGRLAAWQSKTQGELHNAILKIEEALPFVGKKSEEANIHFIHLDEERYYRVLAAAYLASTNPLACYPRDARRNLTLATPSLLPKRQKAYNMILESKSFVIEGQAALTRKKIGHADDCFSKATEKALKAILIVKDIGSRANVTRIEKIWQDLQATPFAENNADLGYLEVQIFTAKHPYVFL